jgi:signal peptidase I
MSFSFILRRIHGSSMLPALRPKQIILAKRYPRRLHVGDVIIFEHRNLEKIKRVQKLRSHELFIEGDNALSSTDSREFGWLPIDKVIAKVLWPRK